jgi:hypothetical protein
VPLSGLTSRCSNAVRESYKQRPGLGGIKCQIWFKDRQEIQPSEWSGPPFSPIESSDYFLNASRTSLGEQHWHLVDWSCNYRALQRVHLVAVTLWRADAVFQGLFTRVLPIVVCLSISPLPGSLCMRSG